MREMLEHAIRMAQHPVEHRLAVILVPAPQDMMMRAGNDLNRIELYEAQRADDTHHVDRPRRGR